LSKNIIYIIGSGRSGTTLLDILLGNQSGFFSAGELNRYPKRNGIPHDSRDRDVDLFWESVKENINIAPQGVKSTSDKLEYHLGWVKKFFVSKKEKELYYRFTSELFSSIDKNSNNPEYIIDSSKYPLRALLLSKVFNDKISYIYIQRNPDDVVESFQKKGIEQPTKSRFKAHAYLFIVNFLAFRVLLKLKRKHKVVTIRYFDLVNEPINTFSEIERNLNVSLHDLHSIWNNNEKFNVGKLFDGNRLRLNNSISIKPSLKKEKKRLINKIMYPIHKLFWFK